MSDAQVLHRVVIADDNPAFLAAAANYVAGIPGYVLVGTASSAVEALALVEAAGPDLLLLDLGLAPARGLELLRSVKACPHAPAVVALALFHTQETAARARSAGADGLIGKEAFVTGLAEILPRLFVVRAA